MSAATSAAIDEPLRRHLAHALPGGGGSRAGVRLAMRGWIKAGVRLPFRAEQECRRAGFECGAVRSVEGARWGERRDGTFGYIPFGAVVHAERRFGDLVVPSSVTAGWWVGTPHWAPFFRAEITAAEPIAC